VTTAALQVVRLWGLGVVYVYGESPPRDSEDGSTVEVVGKLLGVEGGAGYDELQVRAEARNVLDETEEDVCVERPFMGLVDHHDRVGCEIWFAEELAQEHAVRHVL